MLIFELLRKNKFKAWENNFSAKKFIHFLTYRNQHPVHQLKQQQQNYNNNKNNYNNNNKKQQLQQQRQQFFLQFFISSTIHKKSTGFYEFKFIHLWTNSDENF